MTHDIDNSYYDPRTRAKADGSPFSSHRGTVADVVLTDDESGDETHHAVPVCFEVCPTCTETSVVITGNLVDGHNIYGPFATAEDANNWADCEQAGADWWVAPLLGIPNDERSTP